MICANDDSGKNCPDCLCMFTPVVVIATHERTEVTTLNIELLKKQSIVPKIVIVCSLQTELQYYKAFDVTVILHPNRPLGNKWQAGVNAAIKLGANPLIILGSDDILSEGYIERALKKLKEGFHFIGLTHWFTFDKLNNQVYSHRYTNRNEDFPIGSGKVYSKSLLEKIRGRIFDQRVDRRLDDNGHKLTISSGAKVFLIRKPEVLAFKGNWHQMNTIEAYKKSPNIMTETAVNDILKNFGLCAE